MEMDVVDQYSLSVECFNHDLLESDELIGTATCSLLPAFKRGRSSKRYFLLSIVAVASTIQTSYEKVEQTATRWYAISSSVPFSTPISKLILTIRYLPTLSL